MPRKFARVLLIGFDDCHLFVFVKFKGFLKGPTKEYAEF